MDDSIKGTINNGSIALAAYTKLQFSDEMCTGALAEALLRYCELDTMSMEFIGNTLWRLLIKIFTNFEGVDDFVSDHKLIT